MKIGQTKKKLFGILMNPDNSDSVASVVSRIGAHFFGKDGSRGADGVERQVGAKKFKM